MFLFASAAADGKFCSTPWTGTANPACVRLCVKLCLPHTFASTQQWAMHKISWVSKQCHMLPVALVDARLKAAPYVTGEVLLQTCRSPPPAGGHNEYEPNLLHLETLFTRACLWAAALILCICLDIACYCVCACPYNRYLLSVSNSLPTMLFLRSTVLPSILLVSWQ